MRVDGDTLSTTAALRIAGAPLIDPTFLRHPDAIYLFANRQDEGASILRLFHSHSLFAEFVEHPSSPIRVSARGSRMGGGIIRGPYGYTRLGQDFRVSYGDALLSFRIDELSTTVYRESELGRIAFRTVKGPHTLNFEGERCVFDWYVEQFSPYAGLRRLAAKF